ncbi:MAG: hypothetical protein KBB39_17055 [Phycicoccus sp.]|nr:hypothetical protein [Phycicoccus sp.]
MSRRTQLILHGLSTFDVPHLRGWQPDDPDRFAEVIWIDIGHRSTRGSDQFTLRVATPAGLAGLQAHRGVVATRPLLVMDRYDYGDLWRWLEDVVTTCDGPDWRECVKRLRRYFDWEYDDMTEPGRF